jgi:hypothetical protein
MVIGASLQTGVIESTHNGRWADASAGSSVGVSDFGSVSASTVEICRVVVSGFAYASLVTWSLRS